MKRFMGLMPVECIEISKEFKDENGRIVHIDAGPEGWTIVYPDMSADYEDNIASSEENFQKAYDVANAISALTLQKIIA